MKRPSLVSHPVAARSRCITAARTRRLPARGFSLPRFGLPLLCALLVPMGFGLGCGGDAAGIVDAGGIDVDSGRDVSNSPPQFAVSADMLNRTLSVVDVNRLVEGGTRADALVGTVDLGAYTPGPMSLAVAPDGKTVLVSISAGFLGLLAGVPAGDDKLLFVDLDTLTVTGELEVGSGPMGIVFSHDGKRAFVGLFGESYFAAVDVENRTFEPIETGALFNEELSIDDSGEVGIISYGPAGDVRTFSVTDPASVLGQTSGLTGDSAGVAFFPGTKIAYLMQAPTPLTGNVGGYDLVDVSDPSAPVVIDSMRVEAHPTTYPVTAVHARGSVAFPATSGGRLSLVEMKLEDGHAREVQRIVVGIGGSLAYGVGETRDGRVLIADPTRRQVAVVDLDAGTAFTVPWEGTEYGPTEIKLIPSP